MIGVTETGAPRPTRRSAGVLLFRRRLGAPEVLLILPGGPFWRGRDQGAWQIPKGAAEDQETARETALREAEEELGTRLTSPLIPLGQVRQAGGKLVEAFAVEQDLDPETIVSNEFELEWPRRSGHIRRFPEVERAAWYDLPTARLMMLPSQQPLLDRLAELLAGDAEAGRLVHQD